MVPVLELGKSVDDEPLDVLALGNFIPRLCSLGLIKIIVNKSQLAQCASFSCKRAPFMNKVYILNKIFACNLSMNLAGNF